MLRYVKNRFIQILQYSNLEMSKYSRTVEYNLSQRVNCVENNDKNLFKRETKK